MKHYKYPTVGPK